MLTLKQFRSRYGITQKELAEKVGVTPTTLSKYENGEWTINQYVIDKVKELYNVDIRPLRRMNGTKKPRKVWMKKK